MLKTTIQACFEARNDSLISPYSFCFPFNDISKIREVMAYHLHVPLYCIILKKKRKERNNRKRQRLHGQNGPFKGPMCLLGILVHLKVHF